jgi:hypothetical protein
MWLPKSWNGISATPDGERTRAGAVGGGQRAAGDNEPAEAASGEGWRIVR